MTPTPSGAPSFSSAINRPDDYEVRYEGRTIGRILRMNSTARENWLWTQIGWGSSHDPNGGIADSLDEAKGGVPAGVGMRTGIWSGARYGVFGQHGGRTPQHRSRRGPQGALASWSDPTPLLLT